MNPLSIYNTEQLRNESSASRDGNLFSAFLEFTVADGQTENIVLDIPSGIDVFAFSWIAEVGGKTCTIQRGTCTSFTAGAQSMQGLNIDRRGADDALSAITDTSTLVGFKPVSYTQTYTVGGIGPTQAPMTGGGSGPQPSYRNGIEYPVAQIVNLGGGPATVKVGFQWQELPN